MSRTKLVVTATAAFLGGALAGCSGSSFSASGWLNAKSSATQAQALQFESEPTGADVHTALGQTCQTPCTLAVLSETQSVTFEKNGFQPQTVKISVSEQAEHSLFSKDPAPALTPNPVKVALKPDAPPPEPVITISPPKPVTRQEPTPAYKHYWPSSGPTPQQP